MVFACPFFPPVTFVAVSAEVGPPVLSLFSLRLYESPGGNLVDGLPPVQHFGDKNQDICLSMCSFAAGIMFLPCLGF